MSNENRNKTKTADEIAEAADDDAVLVVTLEYDDGTVVETEAMGVFEANGKEYIALIPDDGSDDVYLYGYEETDDEFKLVDIEDDAEFKTAVAEFDKLVAAEDDE